MSAVQTLLQSLPSPVRRAIYSTLALVGLALGLCQVFDVSTLGPVTVDQALQAYALLSSATGAVAVANVSSAADAEAPAGDVEEDAPELSSFEPVGSSDDVYGAGIA